MQRRITLLPLALLAPLAVLTTPLGVACGGGSSSEDDSADGDADGDSDADFPNVSCAEIDGDCVQIPASDPQGLQDATQSLADGMTVILGLGTFNLDNQVTVRGASGVTLLGQGMDETVLDFGSQAAQSNGVDVIGDDFTIEGLTILDAKKDGLRIEDSDGVVIRRVRATWTDEGLSTNGAYGLYPVKVAHVLIEESEAFNSSDAGIYVGQCRHAIVRNNLARGNVAGIEIENTQYADVYGNTAENNTGGLVVFDLPGNPVVGHDVRIHDNVVINNNHENFAPGGTVAEIPPGTGTFALASRRVEIDHNTYENNDTVDIALLSGLTIVADESQWELNEADLVGDLVDTDLDPGSAAGTVTNFRTDNIYIHDNTHSGSGTNPGILQELGILIALVYGDEPVDEIIYDTVGESAFDPATTEGNSNDNLICVAPSTGATFASVNIPSLIANSGGTVDDLYRPAPPFAPFDCEGFANGPVAPPDFDP